MIEKGEGAKTIPYDHLQLWVPILLTLLTSGMATLTTENDARGGRGETKVATTRSSSLGGLDWTPPSTTNEAVKLQNNLKQHLDQLLEKKRWSENAVQEHIDQARAYLNICKIDSLQDLEMLKQVQEKLETIYVEAYAAVGKVLSKGSSEWPVVLALGQKMEVSDRSKAAPPPPSLFSSHSRCFCLFMVVLLLFQQQSNLF